MKILVADSVSGGAVDISQEQKSWDVVFLPVKTRTLGARDEIVDADALIVRSATKVTAALLEKAVRNSAPPLRRYWWWITSTSKLPRKRASWS